MTAPKTPEPYDAYGVFPHAYQNVPSGQGYVDRGMLDGKAYDAYNYRDIAPIRAFKRRSDARKYADKLTFGP